MTKLEEQLVAEYLRDFNISRASLVVGKDVTWGRRKLDTPRVRIAIDRRVAETAYRLNLNANEVFKFLLEVMRANPKELFNAAGSLKPINQWPDDIARIIEEVGLDDQGRVKKIKYVSKLKALEMLGKHLGLFVDQVHHTGKLSLEQAVMESYEGHEDG